MPPNAGVTADSIVVMLQFAPLSRRELAEVLGVSYQTANYHVNRLVKAHRIQAFERKLTGKRGAPTLRYVASPQEAEEPAAPQGLPAGVAHG